MFERLKREAGSVLRKEGEKLQKTLHRLCRDKALLAKTLGGLGLCIAVVVIYVVRYQLPGEGFTVERREDSFVLAETVHGSDDTVDPIDRELSGEAGGSSNKEDIVPETWILHIDGAVAKPGIYELGEGSRVYQLIEAAGGLLENADGSDLNQAALLTDGLKLYVPTKTETAAGKPAGILFSEPVRSGSTNGGQTAAAPSKININTATKAQLETLPGIGPVAAEKIINYRKKAGGFPSTEALMNVSGIGEKTFAKLKDRICTE